MARPMAIIFIGPPGSGKGTQANEVLRRFNGLHHFNTGRVIEGALYNERNKDNPTIQGERERFEKGLLCSSDWVTHIVDEGVHRIALEGKGIIFSGSPRTREEAEILIPMLADIYGAKNVVVFHILLSDEISVFRNTHRRVCKSCGTPVPWSKETEEQAFCASCGGELVTRTLDTEEAMHTRTQVYRKRVEPILEFCIALGIPIHDVDGERDPMAIADDVERILKSEYHL